MKLLKLISIRSLEDMAEFGRNAPCPCGSGKKYKTCCLAKSPTPPAPRTCPDSGTELPSGVRMVEHEGQTFVTSKGVTLDEIEAAADYFERKRQGQGPAQQIADFSQPLMDAAGNDPVAFQNALSLGSIFWNLAVCKEESVRKEMLEDLAKHTSKTEEERRGFRALAMMMINRHQAMFPEMHG